MSHKSVSLDRAVLETLGWTPEKTGSPHTTDDLRAWHRIAHHRDDYYREVCEQLDALAEELEKTYTSANGYDTNAEHIELLTFHRFRGRADEVDLGLPYAYERFDIRDAYVHRRRGDTLIRTAGSEKFQEGRRVVYAALAAENLHLIDLCRSADIHAEDLSGLRQKYGVSAEWCLNYQRARSWATRELAADQTLMRLDPSGNYFDDILTELSWWTDESDRALKGERDLVNAIARRYRLFLAAGIGRELARRLLGADGTAEELITLHHEVSAEYMNELITIGRWTADWAEPLRSVQK